jgi:hypothetical protein
MPILNIMLDAEKEVLIQNIQGGENPSFSVHQSKKLVP